jgi:EAL domain-containing protein (putative c-di-GMP-specific phosphodiesterase class I)
MFRCLVACGTEPTPGARAAGRRAVAEFVSDQDTPELLAELGVDLAQGFHVGRPRPLEEL